MGSKKTRSREIKEEKRLKEEKVNKEVSAKTTKRKSTALLNMCALLSIIIIIYMGSFMDKTVGPDAKLTDSTTLIQKNLNLEDAEAISSVYSNDATYVLYKQNDNLGLVKGTPAKFMTSRYYLDTDLKLIPNNKKVSVITHRYEYGKKDNVIVYGDLTATKAKYAEVTYNGKIEKIEFESTAPFMELIAFDVADNQTPTVNIFDINNNDITEELMNL